MTSPGIKHVCDDSNNFGPRGLKNHVIFETKIDMDTPEGKRIIKNFGATREEFPEDGSITMLHSIDKEGNINSVMSYTAKKDK